MSFLALSIFHMYNERKERKESMAIYENHDIEFKQEYVAEINKEVIAFANASGGTILIGIQNNGIVCGVEDPECYE